MTQRQFYYSLESVDWLMIKRHSTGLVTHGVGIYQLINKGTVLVLLFTEFVE